LNAPWSPEIGIGFYTVPQVASLLHLPALNIRRWLGGYTFHSRDGESHEMPPLWTPQLPAWDSHIELGFRDLIELRFVKAFLDAGLGLLTIRHCLEYARTYVDDERPFSTRRFQTDGKTIFLESAARAGDEEVLNLKNGQYVIRQVIDRTFKDLDIEDNTVRRWWPMRGRRTVVIDPARSFGQPIVARYGVPTLVLSQAVKSEGSTAAAARAFEVPERAVREAVAFERSLAGS
jgi:uncharacterized protein (DUF433 family)